MGRENIYLVYKIRHIVPKFVYCTMRFIPLNDTIRVVTIRVHSQGKQCHVTQRASAKITV